MSFKLEQIRRDLIANAKSSELWDLVDVYGKQLDIKLNEAMAQGVLIAEKDPLKFVASLITSMDRNVPIILGNHQWGESEWVLFDQLFSPAVICGLQKSTDGNQPVFKEKDQGSILIPTGGTSSDALRFAIHRWESLEAQSLMVQTFLGDKAINSICCLPLFHVSGLMQVIRAIASNGQILFSQLNELESASKLVAVEDFCLSLVPTQLSRLISKGFIFEKMDKFKAIFLGGAPTSDSLLKKAKDYSLPIVMSYGMTETAGMICAQSKESFLAGNFSSGKPLFGAEIKLNTREGFNILHVHSKSLFYGYWGSQLFERGEGLSSNDYGHFLEDGQLIIEGRTDNWIISGGEKINPKEVEESLNASGYIESALVIGKDSKEWGQALVGILVPKGDLTDKVLVDNLNDYLKQNLANHKLPKAYLFVEELPILENGKRDNGQIGKLLYSVTVD
ncbi:MAG: 2-succinylbenzoate--CoA ligase [Puniceicoccaceae bacterium MED-G32]|nr:MAG: 2-succinylbenzoate--CoA ligase [Puniceicoccaceae bacterium MED-G32]